MISEFPLFKTTVFLMLWIESVEYTFNCVVIDMTHVTSHWTLMLFVTSLESEIEYVCADLRRLNWYAISMKVLLTNHLSCLQFSRNMSLILPGNTCFLPASRMFPVPNIVMKWMISIGSVIYSGMVTFLPSLKTSRMIKV